MSVGSSESLSEMKDIKDFIASRDYKFESRGWFSDIWTPLFRDNDILITKNILNFLWSGGNNPSMNNEEFRQCVLEFESYLKANDIEFYPAKYHEDILKEYEVLGGELKTWSADELKDQIWLVLKSEDFKKAVMFVNNEHSKFIKDYYIVLEKIYDDYTKYIHEYVLSIEKTKNEELSRKNANMDVFVQNVKAKTMDGYIYIATTTLYANENTFKVGIAQDLENRLSQYNTGRPTDDLYYYCFYKKGYNYRNIEKIILDVLCEFKVSSDKEMVVLHYTVLFEVVEMVIKNINEPYDYINRIIKTRLGGLYNLRPLIPKPMNFDSEQILFNGLSGKIMSLFDDYIKKKKFTVSRNELLDQLAVGDFQRQRIWIFIKDFTEWKNSKKPIEHNNHKITITY